ncbi:unnamed protein product [Closterium sp. NIES-64]|nr:unnamed protein product [Closterium sp. NIES-64]CAI6010201.1 unnamed protein product [Closterium sp. NIES-65]
MRHVERSLASESASQCKQWPESCWPVPHVPFSFLSDFPQRRYLVVTFTMEQMSNARTHLAEAARVAEESGRILVLPKADCSRLSVARQHPLCSYWDLSRFSRVEWVSSDFFLLTARAAFLNPSVGFVCVITESLHRPCFNYRELVAILGEVLTFAMGHVPVPSNTIDVKMPQTKEVFNMLLHAWSDRDVVVWMKTTFQRIDYVPKTDVVARAVLPYRAKWHDTAAQIIAKLPKPVIGVHFRSEFISWNVAQGLHANLTWEEVQHNLRQQMAVCVQGAASKINQVRKELQTQHWQEQTQQENQGKQGQKQEQQEQQKQREQEEKERLINGLGQLVEGPTVFIAADIPFNESAAVQARSESWKSMEVWLGRENTGRASRGALKWLRQQVEGTVMIDEVMPAINGYDPGIVSILDKLVTAKADVFVAAERYCGGKRGFESDILQHRDEYGQPADSVVRWGYEKEA